MTPIMNGRMVFFAELFIQQHDQRHYGDEGDHDDPQQVFRHDHVELCTERRADHGGYTGDEARTEMHLAAVGVAQE